LDAQAHDTGTGQQSVLEARQGKLEERYGTARNISKVVNDMVEEEMKKVDIMNLTSSEKIAETSAREFEQFRRKLSNRLEH
jgi:hypothetical protein